ncbi:unnamed protein product [Amoebophrya sp. A25]|nr:unnamed protein product [Amoebophrya sp. A25]|eukprot:GSA25T00018918001.1
MTGACFVQSDGPRGEILRRILQDEFSLYCVTTSKGKNLQREHIMRREEKEEDGSSSSSFTSDTNAATGGSDCSSTTCSSEDENNRTGENVALDRKFGMRRNAQKEKRAPLSLLSKKMIQSTADLDRIRCLRFVWFHNALQVERFWKSYDKITPSMLTTSSTRNSCHTTPNKTTHLLHEEIQEQEMFVSRLRNSMLLDNKLELWKLAGRTGWLPEVFTGETKDENSISSSSEISSSRSRSRVICKPVSGAKGNGIQIKDANFQLSKNELCESGCSGGGTTTERSTSTAAIVASTSSSSSSTSSSSTSTVLVQKYIENPLLLFRRYKFDIRQYVLIVCRGPGKYDGYLCDGYIRRCPAPYAATAVGRTNMAAVDDYLRATCDSGDPSRSRTTVGKDGSDVLDLEESLNEEDCYSQLSNWSITKHFPGYNQAADEVRSVPLRIPLTRFMFGRARTTSMRLKVQRCIHDVVAAYVEERKQRQQQPDHDKAGAAGGVDARMTTSTTSTSRLSTKTNTASTTTCSLRSVDLPGQFELFGVDFLFDGDFKLYLLEFNSGCGVRWNAKFLRRIHKRMYEDMVRLVLPSTSRHYNIDDSTSTASIVPEEAAPGGEMLGAPSCRTTSSVDVDSRESPIGQHGRTPWVQVYPELP